MLSTLTPVAYKAGDRVNVDYCEPGTIAHDRWSGPATVVRVNGSTVTVETDSGHLGGFALSELTLMPTSTVVHDQSAMAALPAGTLVEDRDEDIAIVTTDGRIVFETIFGRTLADTAPSTFDSLKFPVEVLNPEILDEPEVGGFLIGDKVSILTDALGERFVGMTGEVVGYCHGQYNEVRVTDEPGTQLPLRDDELEAATVELRTPLFCKGQLVSLLSSASKAAEVGALATVTEDYFVGDFYLRVAWDRSDSRTQGQNDGGYFASDFILVDEPLAEWERELLGMSEPVKVEPQVGDTLRVIDPEGAFDAELGDVVKVTRLEENVGQFGLGAHYLTVRRLRDGISYAMFSGRFEPFVSTLKVGDEVLVPRDVETVQNTGVYFGIDTVGVVLTEVDENGNVEVRALAETGSTIRQIVDPAYLTLVEKDEPVADSVMVGATVEDDDALADLPNGTIIQLNSPRSTPRVKIEGDWYFAAKMDPFTGSLDSGVVNFTTSYIVNNVGGCVLFVPSA